MGQSKSKNISEAISKIANNISNNIVVGSSTSSYLENILRLNQCYITGSVTVENVADIIGSNRQLQQAIQDTTIINKIAQQIVQEATAIAEPLNMSHTEKQSFVYAFISKSKKIINVIDNISKQGAYMNNKFVCDRQFIVGDVNVGFSTRKAFWDYHISNNNEVNNISQEIIQSITQKTSSKPATISSIIIVVMVFICFLLSFKTSNKKLSNFLLILITLLLLSLPFILYFNKVYPFYLNPVNCSSLNYKLKQSDCKDCIDYSSKNYKIENPPTRYAFNILFNPNDKNLPYGLLNMAVNINIRSEDYDYNQGYNAQSWWSMNNNGNWNIDKSSDPVPNPLKVVKICNNNRDYCRIPDTYIYKLNSTTSNTPSVYNPNSKNFVINNYISNVNLGKDSNTTNDINTRRYTMAEINIEEWKKYIESSKQRSLHARFILCYILGIDTSVYIDENEEVLLSDGSIGKAKENLDSLYFFNPSKEYQEYQNRIEEGGIITGKLGVCNNRKYQVNKFFVSTGNWILITLLCILVYIIYRKISR